MKPGRLKKLVASGLLAVGLASMSSSAHAAANVAIARAVEGTASYSIDGGKTWRPVEKDFRFDPSTIIRTGVGSRVDLFLGVNGPVVRILPNTQLALDKLDASTDPTPVIDTELNLSNGEILGNVKRLAEGSKYSVITPLGVAGVRATDHETEYDISADGTVHVIMGSMVVSYINTADPAHPSIVTVNAGETSHAPVHPGEVVTAMPTPPDILAQLNTERSDLNQALQRYIVTVPPPAPGSPSQNNPIGVLPPPQITSSVTIQPIIFVSPINGFHAPGGTQP